MIRIKRRGFTIVEMMTVFTIIVIIGYLLALVTKQVMRSYLLIRGEQQILDSQRSVAQSFMRDLENAYVSQTDTRFVFLGTSTTLNFNSILLQASGAPELVEVGYSLSGLDEIERRFESGAALPNDVSTGGMTDVLAAHVSSFSIRYGYRDNAGAIIYTAANWDSRINNFPNFDGHGEAKIPDGLPNIVEITYAVSDKEGTIDPQLRTVKIYLPNDTYIK